MCPNIEQERLHANKQLLRRMIEEVFNQAKPERLPEFWADTPGASPEQATTLAEVEGLHRLLHAAYPDRQIEIDDMIAENDRVATRLTFRGTHQGTFRGIAPTGRTVQFSANRVYRIDGGKFVQTWAVVDIFSLIAQLQE